MDEIHPEMLEALDILGLSWLTRLFNAMLKLWTMPTAWQGDQRVCSNYLGITLLSLSGKAYALLLEGPNLRSVGISANAILVMVMN